MAEGTEPETNPRIDNITGDYRPALLKLTWPTMLSLACTIIYNLIDSVWVAGLGPDAIAAIGFITPIFLIFTGLGNGIALGVNSLISQYIGVKDYKSASNSSVHALILAIILSLIGAVIMNLLLPDILNILGANGVVFDYALEYGRIFFISLIIFIYSNVSSGILRGEGDGKRVLYALAITSIINIIVDPIFIYTFNMGLRGAALTTVFSVTVSCIIFFYWTIIQKNTFIKISFKYYSFNWKIFTRILNVAIPCISETVLMGFLAILIIHLLSSNSGADAVAVFTITYKLIELGLTPIVGVGQALLTLTGTSIGAGDFDRLKRTYYRAIIIVFIIGIIIAVSFFITAPVLCRIFAYSESAALLPELIASLRILCFWLIGTALGMLGSMFFQGMSKGFHSLVLIFIRTFLLEIVVTWILAVVFHLSEHGVYFSVTIGCIIGGLISVLYSIIYLGINDDFKQKENNI